MILCWEVVGALELGGDTGLEPTLEVEKREGWKVHSALSNFSKHLPRIPTSVTPLPLDLLSTL